MNKLVVLLTTVFILAFGIGSSFGQNVSEEARRHFDRGKAALKMANSTADCEAAIKEFEQATRLAPDWPDVFYNLGLAQEKAEKYRNAVRSYQQYLRLAPNARDAEEVKSILNELEYKAEQFISDSEALDIFGSLGDLSNTKWNFSGDISPRGTAYSFRMVGDKIEFQYFGAIDIGYRTQFAQVTGRILEYYSAYASDVELFRNKVVMEIVSRTKIKGSAIETMEPKEKWISKIPNKTFDFEFNLKPEYAAAALSGIDPSINARDNKGKTQLYHAIWGGHKEMIELLIAKGADINARNGDGDTPLHSSIMIGNSQDMAELLIAKGADINAKDKDGRTPLHLAALNGYKEVAELLIAKGADVNAKDKDGQTPLQNAALQAPKEVVELLIVKGADVNAKDQYGNTPLHDAVDNNKKEVAELLIANGADINVKGLGDRAPLHDAAERGQMEIVEMLITKGADVNAKDNEGKTPLQIAESKNQKEVTNLLKKHGGK